MNEGCLHCYREIINLILPRHDGYKLVERVQRRKVFATLDFEMGSSRNLWGRLSPLWFLKERSQVITKHDSRALLFTEQPQAWEKWIAFLEQPGVHVWEYQYCVCGKYTRESHTLWEGNILGRKTAFYGLVAIDTFCLCRGRTRDLKWDLDFRFEPSSALYYLYKAPFLPS